MFLKIIIYDFFFFFLLDLKSQNAPSIEEYAKAIGESIKQRFVFFYLFISFAIDFISFFISCKKFELQLPLITVEPGRSITARAAIAVYTVGGTKVLWVLINV